MIFPSQSFLSQRSSQLPAQGALRGKIMEGDNFQNYGRKDHAMYLYVMWVQIII